MTNANPGLGTGSVHENLSSEFQLLPKGSVAVEVTTLGAPPQTERKIFALSRIVADTTYPEEQRLSAVRYLSEVSDRFRSAAIGPLADSVRHDPSAAVRRFAAQGLRQLDSDLAERLSDREVEPLGPPEQESGTDKKETRGKLSLESTNKNIYILRMTPDEQQKINEALYDLDNPPEDYSQAMDKLDSADKTFRKLIADRFTRLLRRELNSRLKQNPPAGKLDSEADIDADRDRKNAIKQFIDSQLERFGFAFRFPTGVPSILIVQGDSKGFGRFQLKSRSGQKRNVDLESWALSMRSEHEPGSRESISPDKDAEPIFIPDITLSQEAELPSGGFAHRTGKRQKRPFPPER